MVIKIGKIDVYNNVGRYNTSNTESTGLSEKMPGNVTSLPRSRADNFYQISCENLCVFSQKAEGDFSPWPDEKFDELVASIRELGVLHPIIVRKKNDDEGKYEILAGEHRWKASIFLELPMIPALIIDPCDDDKAYTIFSVTNVLNRDLTLADKIFGWGKYYEATKGKTQETIKQLQEEGILGKCEGDDLSKRTIYRYHKINSLIPEIREKVLEEKISLRTGESLSELTLEEQNLLLPYQTQLESANKVKKIIDLKQGNCIGYKFDNAGLEYVLSDNSPEYDKKTFSNAMKDAKDILRANIDKNDYSNVSVILTEAFELYNEFGGKIEVIRKALEAYEHSPPQEN